MKSWTLHASVDIRCDDTAVPEIKDNEVLVRVKAAGICGSDIPRIYNGGAYFYPLIPGHEFSGQVENCGSEVDTKWKGKRVGIFPLIPCGECRPCKKNLYEMCRKYSYLGPRRHGGFAEYVAVPADNLIELPDNVSFDEAAMMEPMAVTAHSLRRTELNPDDKVVICGLGTIGMFILMLLMEKGIRNIFVIGNKESQKKKITELGISEDHYCDAKSENAGEWIQKVTGDGADVYFECVGKLLSSKLSAEASVTLNADDIPA